ncbi:NAD(P)-dependent oxidoreductase [Paenibacillus sp. N3.4]|uniref:NAD(P)-dependent oxidoreductase n=1 Tax=Paenibacillus sp. N3.4 TaxID=2603222 RepID=UPI0011CAE84F|nr:NAD(P)-dependent oxidoreductase [Paenibacillus sp. N3.4]TXK76940.1 NAD(P)-dependent oxidoreductase [Paenibacillus sp. N3.4]
MNIAIIGASGKAGNLIMKESLDRGHNVTAIVRNASKITNEKVHVVEKDILALTTTDLAPFDVVVNAFGSVPGQEKQHIEAGKVLIEALKGAPHTRLLVVGGAGSLFVDPEKTIRLVDTTEFPAAYEPLARSQGENLQDLLAAEGISWTFLSPAAFFNPEGRRTGAYQAGKDHVITNSEGQSYISYADYAIALVDEIEKPQHVNQRFTVVAEA